MRFPWAHHICAIFLAALVLSVAIIAKIPSSECRCHEGPKKEQTKECPFGKLRILAASTLPVATYSMTDVTEVSESTPFHMEMDTNVVVSDWTPFYAQGPPFI